MRELHVVATSEDGRHVVLATRKGAGSGDFRVALDERLAAAVRGDLPRVGESEPVVVTPKEIQARLRAGESPEQIAASAGVPVTKIDRYAGPVLSERERVLQQARAGFVSRSRLGGSALPLGEAVDRHLSLTTGVRMETVAWSTRREETGTWLVELSYVSQARRRTAAWRYDMIRREVTATDSASAALAHVEPSRRRARQAEPEAFAPATVRPRPTARKGAAVRPAAKARGAGRPAGAARAAAPAARTVAARPTPPVRAAAPVPAAAAPAKAAQTAATRAAAATAARADTARAASKERAAKAAADKAARAAAAEQEKAAARQQAAAEKAAADKAAADKAAEQKAARSKAAADKAAREKAAREKAAREQAAQEKAAAEAARAQAAAQKAQHAATKKAAEKAAAEAAEAARAAEETPSGPPTLRVVGSDKTPARRAPKEPPAAARTAPARAAGQRASVPGWADVLLSTAPVARPSEPETDSD